MTVGTTYGWRDLKAEMTRHGVTVAEVAQQMGYGYARFSTILASEDETQPLRQFAERVLAAVEEIAAVKHGDRAARE